MSNLSQLSTYRNTIINRIIQNQGIIKALYYNNSNFLDKPDVTMNEIAKDIMYSYIYPFNFIPSSSEELKNAKGYLTISIPSVIPVSRNVYFNKGEICISVYLHKDMFKTDYGFIRTDYLAQEIHQIFNGARDIGMGELEFMGYKEAPLNADYHGFLLKYKPVDFNQ